MRVKVLIHKMSAFLLSFMMLLTNIAPTIAYAMEDKARYSKDEYYEYELTREGYKISGLTQEGRDKLYLDDKELIIPSHHKDIPVIGIAKNALSNEKIKTLVLPDSVKEIDDYALYQDKKGEGVEEIRGYSEDSNIILERVGDSSFANNELKEIPISKELGKNTYLNNKIEYADLTYTEKIGDYAFKGNKNLETIVNKYSEVGKKVFEEDTKIEYVEKEFLEKKEESDVDYLTIRQKILETENNIKKEEDEDTKEDDEDVPNYKVEEEVLETENKTKVDPYTFTDPRYQEPEKINKREYNMLRREHKAPSRLSKIFLNTAYASETSRDLDDVKIESISSKWILGEETGSPTYSDEDQIYKWHHESPQFIRLKTDIAISGQKDHDIGAVQIRAPKSIVKKRDGTIAGESGIGIAAYPSKDNAFAYLETDTEYLLINTKPLSAATTISFEMSFKDINPHEIKDYEKTGYAADPFMASIEVLTKFDNAVKKDGNILNAKFDTRAYIESSTKKAQKLYDDAYPEDWPAELKKYVENDEDYVYVAWKTQAVNQGSQPFKVDILDKADTDDLKDVKILGIRRDKDMTYLVEDATNTASYDKMYPENGDYDFIKPGSNFNLTIYTAYPKSNFFDENGNIKKDEYTLRNEITYTLTSEDDQEVTKVPTEGKINYKPRPFPVPNTHVNIFKEGALGNDHYYSGDKYIGQYEEALNDLIINRKVDINYNMNTLVVGEKYTKPEDVTPYGISAYGRKTYTSEISDDEVIFDGRKLDKDEYDFKALNISLRDVYRYTVKYEKWRGYELTADDKFIENKNIPERVWAYERSSGRDNINSKLYDDNDKLLAEIRFDKDGKRTISPKNGAKLDGAYLMLPEGVKGFKLVNEAKESAYQINIKPIITINPSQRIVEDLEAKYAESSTTTLNLENKAKVKLAETTKEDIGKNKLSGEYYTEAYPEGHFMIFKWGDGEDTKLPNNEDFNLHKYLNKTTNRGTPKYLGIYPKHLNDLKDGKEVEVYYEVENEGYGMPWTFDDKTNEEFKAKNPDRKEDFVDEAFNQKAYSMTSRDDRLYFESEKDLTVDDFEFTKIKLQKPQIFDYKKFDKDGYGLRESNQTRFNGVVRRGPIKAGDYGYVENKDVNKMPTFEIFGKVDGKDYEKVGEVKFTDKENYTLKTFNGASADGEFLIFPKGTVAYKVVAETKLDGIIWNQVPYVRLKQSDYIKNFAKKAFEESEAPRKRLNNEANLDIRDSDSDIGNITKVGQDELRGHEYVETDPESHFRITKEGFGDVIKRVDPKNPKSEKYGSYAMYLNRIENGDKNAEISYKVTNTGFGMPFTYDRDKDIFDMKSYGQNSYEMTSRDYFLSFNDEKLNKEDFNFTAVEFDLPTIYDYVQYTEDGYGFIEGGLDWRYFQHLGGSVTPNDKTSINKGQYGYKVTKDYNKLDDFEVFAASDDEVYKKYGDVSFKTGKAVITPTNGATVKENQLRFPEDAEITNYKVVLKTNIAAVEWTHKPQVLIKNSQKVVDMINKLYEETDLPSVDALNKADLNVKLNVGKDNEKNIKVGEATGFDRLDGMIYGVKTFKDSKYKNDTKNEIVDIEYFLTTRIQTNIKDRKDLDYAIENGGFKPETRSIFYDLLPEEVKADPNSIQTEPGAKVISSNVIPNYKDSGRDLLVVEVERTPNYTYVRESDSFIGHEGYADTPYISFKATYSWKSVMDIGKRLRNYSVYRSPNKAFGNYKGFKGEENEPSGKNHKETNIAFKLSDGNEDEKSKELLTGFDDNLTPSLDKTGVSKDQSFLYASHEKYLVIDASSVASLDKTVDADGLGIFASGTEEDTAQNVYEGGTYTYKKTLKAMNSSNIKNIVLYDKLEGYVPEGDKIDYGDTRWQGTYFGIDTSQLQNKGVNPVLYYSTRDDLVLDNTRDRSMNDISDKSIWTKWDDRPKDLNNRDITAIALDVRKNQDGSDFVLKEGASFSYYIKMRAPVLDEDGEKNGKDVYAKTDEEKSEWYDVDREIVDNNIRKVKVPIGTDDEGNILYKELVFVTPIYESEEGLVGGAHAYNNIVAIFDTMGEKGSTELIRHDYTKVGLKPFKINVEKDWKDDNNRDGVRPETLKVEIYANDKLYKTINLTKDKDWKESLFVPYGDDNGKKINYTVKEVVPESYTFDKLNKVENGEGLNLVFENSREPEKVSVKANKTWTDLENLEKEKRPQSITLELYSDENGPMEKVDEAVVKADSEGNWSYEFKNLNKYHDEGKIIKYEIREVEMTDFITTIEDGEFKDNSKLVKINNAYYPYGDLVIKKIVENASKEAIDNNEFKFTINIEKDDSDRIVGDYKAYKEDKDGKIGEDFLVTDGSEVRIKDGERVIVKDIDSRFTYTVSEKDTKAFTLTGVNNREGVISSGGVNEEAFVNRYETKGKAELNLRKDLDGRKLYGYDFRFNVYEIIDGKEELITKNPIANDRNGDIKYNFNYDSKDLGSDNGFVNKTVTKKYVVREVDEGKNDNIHGFFYDDKAIFVDVTLTDDGFGNINTDVSYNKEGWFNKDDQSFTFNNKYRAERPYELETFKYVKDGIKIKENQFKFNLTQVGVYENKDFKNPAKRKEYVENPNETVHFGNYMNGKVVDEAYSDENGKAVFKKYDGKDFIFNQYDIGKTFVFDIKEIDNSASDEKVIFDGFTIRRYVSVYDGGYDSETKKGTLQIEESTEYIIDETSLDKAKADAKKIVEKYRREDSEEIVKKIDDAENIEDVKKILKETEGLFPLFVNEYKPGKIKVSKEVTKGDSNNPGKEFKFRIKLKGEDSKIPDGSLEMKREGNKILPAPGWEPLNENQKYTTDGFTYEYEKKDGEDEIIRGEDDIGPFVGWNYGANKDTPYTDDRIVKFYGEITSEQLKPSEAKEYQTLNTYLQDLVTGGMRFNSNTNWLVYNDNGVEKLVSKKPLRYKVSWNQLYNAGVVFGSKEDAPNPDNYEPRYVNINNKKYVVRLMRAYNENAKTKGSEWNRLILPLIEDIQDSNRKKGGRYGSNSKKGVETNMPSLAKYSWWKDFGGNRNYGIHRWAQEGSSYRARRGNISTTYGAAYSGSGRPNDGKSYHGWLPVLELVNSDVSTVSNAQGKDTRTELASANSRQLLNKKNALGSRPAYAGLGRVQDAFKKMSATTSSTEENSPEGTTQQSESTISTGDPVWEVDSSDTENLTILFRNERPILKISFDANGGQGSMIDIEYDNNIPEGTEVKFYRPNYRFAGWKFYHEENVVERENLDSIKKPDKVVAKAEWEKRDLKVDFADGVGYFTLLAGENGYFDNIPANMDYEIEELTDEQWYNENPKYKDLSQEEKEKLIADAGWSLDSVENNKGKTLSDDTVSANFVNSFEPGKSKISIEGVKTLNGRTTDVENYTVKLYNSDSAWNLGDEIDEAITDNAGRFKFNEINYIGDSSSKTYYYLVKEHNDNKTNIVYDENSYRVQVDVTKVERDGEILLKSTVKYLDGDLVIKNETEKTSINIKKAFKDEASKNAASGKTFKVSVKLSDRANPVILELNEANGYSASIDNLEIGTTYSVSEIDIPEGFKLDRISNESGSVTNKTAEVIVTNSYSSTGKVKIKLTKEMLGRNLNAGEFKFQVFNEDGTEALSDVYTNGSENGPSEIILEVNENTPGMKTYQIKEIPTDDDTVIFDTEPITVKVNMTDDTNGNLVAGEVTVVGDKDRFTNKLKPGNLVIEKTVDNLLSTDIRFNIKVTLLDKDKKEITDEFNYKLSNGNNGVIKSGDTLSVGNKESITIENLPLGTEYKIEEVNIPTGFKLKNIEKAQGIIEEYDGDYKVSVHNEYEAKGNFILRGKKTYKNNPAESLKGKKFRFALLELEHGKKWSDGIDPDNIIYVNTDDNGIINIGPIAVEKEDLYVGDDSEGNRIYDMTKRYKLIEEKGIYDEDGKLIEGEHSKIKYDPSNFEIDVEFEEDNGEIKVKNKTIRKNGKEIKTDDFDFEFTNEYIEEKLTSINIRKEVTGHKEGDDTKFTMRVKLTYPDETERIMSLRLGHNENYRLDKLPIGTEYEITEIGIDDNYRLDGYKVDGGDISKDKTIIGIANENEVTIEVINEVKPKRVKISAQKLLNGRVTSRKFSFNLYEEGNNTPIQTKENIRKLVDFDEIIYEDGFVGPKTYFIEEISTEGDGIIYDKSTFKVVVSEEEELTVKYYKDDKEVENAVFRNETVGLPSTGKIASLLIGVLVLVSAIGYTITKKKEKAYN